MSSGFQQNENQLTPGLYRVTVDLTGYSSTAADTDAGGVETRDSSVFDVPGSALPTTLAIGQRRARGNLRWQGILEALSIGGDNRILDIEELESDASELDDADDVTTNLKFTVQYDRDAFVLGAVQNFLIKEGRTTGDVAKNSDHETLGSATTTSTTLLAIKELVVRGITKGYQDYVTNVSTAVDGNDIFKRSYRVFDGTQGAEIQEVLTVKAPITPKAAHSDVTVTSIDGTTLPTT
jgi:hypothetical protein